MKKYLPLIIVSLLLCLFIYVFYRTEKTLINQIIIELFSFKAYSSVKDTITSILPLKDFVIYSLPEGLWIFCITITSSFFYVEIKERRWSVMAVPIVVAIFMELLQLLHITNGSFDLTDIVFSFIGWLAALLITRYDTNKEPLLSS